MTAGHPAALSSRKIVVDNVRGDAEKLRAVIISDESGQGRYDDLYNRCIAEAVEVKAGDFLFCASRTAWACYVNAMMSPIATSVYKQLTAAPK